MTTRSVSHILPAQEIDMGGLTIKQPLPTQRVSGIDPFLLLHHFGPWEVQPGEDPLDLGPHPHRGFEPVTFLYQGGIRHRDSRNNTGILAEGDVQWMTAGMGIIHSERASDAFKSTGGTIEGIQLWINLPGRDKMVQPDYQDIKSADIPTVDLGHGGHLKVVAGTFGQKSGPVRTHTPINAWQIELAHGEGARLPLPEDHSAFIYLLDGHVKLNDNFDYEGPVLLNFRQDGEGITLEGLAQRSRILLLSGSPLAEPVVNYGPFVMNTQTEIMEALRDYKMGKMGFYVD